MMSPHSRKKGCPKILKAFEAGLIVADGGAPAAKLARTNSGSSTGSSGGGRKRSTSGSPAPGSSRPRHLCQPTQSRKSEAKAGPSGPSGSVEPSSQDSGISLTPKDASAKRGKRKAATATAGRASPTAANADDEFEATQEIDFHSSGVDDDLTNSFVKSAKFDGHRDGYVYKDGDRGKGYYVYNGPLNKKRKASGLPPSHSVAGVGSPTRTSTASARATCNHAEPEEGSTTPVLPCFCECLHATPALPQKPTATTMTLTHARSGIWRNIACTEELTVGRVAGLYGWGVYDRDWTSPCYRSPKAVDMVKATSRICFKLSSSGFRAGTDGAAAGAAGAAGAADAPDATVAAPESAAAVAGPAEGDPAAQAAAAGGHKWFLEVVTESNTVHLRSNLEPEAHVVPRGAPVLLAPGKHVVVACPYNCDRGFCAEPTYGPLAYLLEIPGATAENQAAWTVRP